jgi:hypothetical protein
LNSRKEISMMRGYLLALATAFMATGALAASAQSPLATPDQRALDKQSLRVLASPVVKAQEPLVAQAFAADPYAQTAEGKAILQRAVDEVVYAGVLDSINRDPARSRLQWLWAPAHNWSGIAVPASKVLMPNVDNVFRIFPVDNLHHYRLTAHLAGAAPTQLSLQVLPALPGEDGWSKVIQEVLDSDIHTESDGSFTLTIGPGPSEGQANHITTTQDAHFILIRDTLQGWSHETPYRMELTQLDGPVSTASTDDATLAREAAEVIRQITPRIVQAKGGGFANQPGFYQGPANTLTSPKIREGGRWGLSSSGHFQLADDEALVLTLDPIGARYLAVQLASGWLSSLDYLRHTASLNMSQATPNPDGTLTLVVAPKDPGVANWLDTTGLHEGTLFVRWQKLPTTLDLHAQGVRSVRLVKVADLDPVLPRVSLAERKALLAKRAAAYARRYAD